MLERFNMKMLGGAFVIVVLLCAGIYFYAERSNKRFAAELGEPPQVTTYIRTGLKNGKQTKCHLLNRRHLSSRWNL